MEKPGKEDYIELCEDLRDIEIEWSLPGGGEVSKDDCLVAHGSEACMDSEPGRKIAYTPIRWFCDKPSCPPCFEHWTVTAARETMKKMKAGRQLFEFYGSKYRLCHVVISAPPEYARFLGRRKGYDLLMEDFYRVCDAFNMHGELVFHMWRGKKDEESDATLQAPSDDVDDDYWTLGPHVHTVAYCDPDRICEDAAEFYKSTGFVITVIADDLDDSYAENVLSYALSHCAIGSSKGHKDTKAHHPFGMMATSKDNGLYKLAEITEDAYKSCSECGEPLYNTREIDVRMPVEDMDRARAPLHHVIYVRRSDKAIHKAMIEGLSDAEILDYARKRIPEVAIVFDDRNTIVDACCDVECLLAEERKRLAEWQRPTEGGQSRITPFDVRKPPRLAGCI